MLIRENGLCGAWRELRVVWAPVACAMTRGGVGVYSFV